MQAAARKRAKGDNLAAIGRMNLDQLFEDTKRRVRDHFEKTGEVPGAFLCVTEDHEAFAFEAPWSNPDEKAASFSVLRDAFRARGVVRYAFASEVWMSATKSGPPSEAPDREEGVEVLAVDRDGSRRGTMAKIARDNGTATLANWDKEDCPFKTWLMELVDPAASDVKPKVSGRVPQHVMESDADFDEAMERSQGGLAITATLIIEAFSDVMSSQVQMGALGMVAIGLCLALLIEAKGNEATAKMFKHAAEMLRSAPDKFPVFVPQLNRPEVNAEADRLRHRLYAALEKFDGVDKGVVGEALANFAVNLLARSMGTACLTSYLGWQADMVAAGKVPWEEADNEPPEPDPPEAA
jgi:hypothetical protein